MSLFVVPLGVQSGRQRHKMCPAVDNVKFKLRIRGERRWMSWQMKAFH